MDTLLEERSEHLENLSSTLAEFKRTVDDFLGTRASEQANQVVLASDTVLHELYSVALTNPDRLTLNPQEIIEFCGYSRLALSALHAKHPLASAEQYYAAQISSQCDLASELLINGVQAYEEQRRVRSSVLERVKRSVFRT